MSASETSTGRTDPAVERLLLVADEEEFVSLFLRACDVSYDGECVACRPDNLDAALRAGTPSIIVLHADGLEDRGCALVQRIRGRKGLARTPVLAVGQALGPIERWHLGAAGAFVVRLPSRTVDVFATVIEESLSFARSSRTAADPSHPSTHLQIIADAEGRLPVEALLLLIASTWASGMAPEPCLPALIDAALENGQDEEGVDAIMRACESTIPLVDVNAADLSDPDRWYLYAFALWIAMGHEDTVPQSSPTLQVMGFTLGISPRVRTVMPAILEEQRRDGVCSRETFRREDFQRTMLAELEAVAGLSVHPPPPTQSSASVVPAAPPDEDDDVMEMPDDAIIDDPLVVAS